MLSRWLFRTGFTRHVPRTMPYLRPEYGLFSLFADNIGDDMAEAGHGLPGACILDPLHSIHGSNGIEDVDHRVPGRYGDDHTIHQNDSSSILDDSRQDRSHFLGYADGTSCE